MAIKRPARSGLAALGATLIAVTAGGCGSSTDLPSAARTAGIQRISSDPPASSDPSGPLSPTCELGTAQALELVARRIYGEAHGGRIVQQALLRLRRSLALDRAVLSAKPAQTRRVLHRLIEAQIVGVRVIRGGRVFADVGHASAIAPTSESLLGPEGRVIARVVVSVQGTHGYAQTVSGYTGADTLISAGPVRLAGTLQRVPPRLPAQGEVLYRGVHYRVASFGGSVFPDRPVRISLLVGRKALARCAGPGAPGTSQARVDTLGEIAIRIYQGEVSGEKTREAVHIIERSPAFRAAIAGDDPLAAREAIVAMFRSHIHVVRVRVFRGSELLVDVGGPYVLAPASGTVRGTGGKPIGHFELAIQDDMGYLHLAREFTGAQVLLRAGATQVMGTLRPGPASIPPQGSIAYEGQAYRAFSFEGEAFPSGPLRISLLIPSG